MKVKHVAKLVGDAYIIRDAEGKLVAIYAEGVLMIDDLEIAVATLEEAMEMVGEKA